MIVLRENNPHRLDGKKYSNFGNSPINYKTKMMQNNGFAMPSSHLPFFEGGHGCPKLNAQRLCKDAKPTKRSFNGKDIVQGEGIVRFLKRLWEWKGLVQQSSKFAMLCTATEKIGYCAVPD